MGHATQKPYRQSGKVASMSFRDLHYADEPLLLPNAWDVASGRIQRALTSIWTGYPARSTATVEGGVSTDAAPAVGLGSRCRYA
jgi:hypothetical protein